VMKVRINRKKNVLEKLVLQCFMDVKWISMELATRSVTILISLLDFALPNCALMYLLRHIGGLVVFVLLLNFYFLNQFRRNCHHKITDASCILFCSNSPWYGWNIAESGAKHNKLINHFSKKRINLSDILNHKEVTSHVPE
jgi:hypothetical protein